jgi:sulfur-carrier protein adenylyltransferase/sulfurtransferase
MDGLETMDADALKAFMRQRKERDYLLIDVRQPLEYGERHIPGARLIPLMELQSRVFELPDDRDLIFYCHVGGRSLAAADLAAAAEVTERPIRHLEGGILAWEGRTVPDFPRVDLFESARELSDRLMIAMNLEKGAFRFYTALVARHGSEAFGGVADVLSRAETAHARTLYHFWKGTVADPRPFDELFAALDGDILEGGRSLDEVLTRAETIEGDPCVTLLELAMTVEYSAYDLYRNMAEAADDPEAREAFLAIAQAEKAHMRQLGEGIVACVG